MPMNMGIHRKPIGQDQSAFLDSRACGNDGGMLFLRNRLRDLHQNKIPIFGRGGWRSQPPFPKMGIYFGEARLQNP